MMNYTYQLKERVSTIWNALRKKRPAGMPSTLIHIVNTQARRARLNTEWQAFMSEKIESFFR